MQSLRSFATEAWYAQKSFLGSASRQEWHSNWQTLQGSFLAVSEPNFASPVKFAASRDAAPGSALVICRSPPIPQVYLSTLAIGMEAWDRERSPLDADR